MNVCEYKVDLIEKKMFDCWQTDVSNKLWLFASGQTEINVQIVLFSLNIHNI